MYFDEGTCRPNRDLACDNADSHNHNSGKISISISRKSGALPRRASESSNSKHREYKDKGRIVTVTSTITTTSADVRSTTRLYAVHDNVFLGQMADNPVSSKNDKNTIQYLRIPKGQSLLA